MNGRQLVVLCVGLVVLAGMGLYCPWRIETTIPPKVVRGWCGGLCDVKIQTTYDWYWKSEGRSGDWTYRFVETDRLKNQVLAWAGVMFVAFIAARSWGKEKALESAR